MMQMDYSDNILSFYQGQDKELTLPDGIRRIEKAVFQDDAHLEKITLPGSLVSIGDHAFAMCRNLKSLELPDSVTTIGGSAFQACAKLRKIVIPDSVTEIGRNAFANTGWLNAKKFRSFVIVGDNVLLCCNKHTANISVPAKVRHIGGSAFAFHRDLQTVDIPEGVDSIGDGAFENCFRLRSVKLPSTIRTIGEEAFASCDDLEQIELPPDIHSIGAGAFRNCGKLRSVVLPERLWHIGAEAFAGCTALCEIVLPEKLRTVGRGAFSGCTALQHIRFPGNVQEMAEDICSGCTALKTVILPEQLGIVWQGAFRDCTALTEIIIPDGAELIETEAFAGCSALKQVQLPAHLKEIGERAFAGCLALREITLPAETEIVRTQAFLQCKALASVTLKGSIGDISPHAFAETAWAEAKEPAWCIEQGILFRCPDMRHITIPDTVHKLLGDLGGPKQVETFTLSEQVTDMRLFTAKYKFLELVRKDCRVRIHSGTDTEARAEDVQRLYRFWEEKDIENRQRLFFDIKSEAFKHSLAVLMSLSEPDNVFFSSYVKRYIRGIIAYLTELNDVENIRRLLPLGYVDEKYIDSLLEQAIAHTQATGEAEVQLLLMEYKNRNIGFSDLDDIISEAFDF